MSQYNINQSSNQSLNQFSSQSTSARCCNCRRMRDLIIKVCKKTCKFCDEEKLKEFILEIIKEYCKFCDEETLKEFIIEICKEYPGPPGKDGITPHIGDNGNWFIGDTDTGISAQGQKGDAGDDGLSAYEIAVEHGYIGTIDEWLASLKGDKGDPGPSGSGNLKGLHMQLHNQANQRIGSPSPFDTTIFDASDGAVTYENGGFALRENGIYKIDWEIAYRNPSSTSAADIMFFANNGGYALESTKSPEGIISGSVLIPTFVLPLYVGLKKESSQDLYYSDVSVQANIVITKISSNY